MIEFAQVCEMQFWRKIFTASILILIPTPTLVTGSTRELGVELHRVTWINTLQMKFRSGR